MKIRNIGYGFFNVNGYISDKRRENVVQKIYVEGIIGRCEYKSSNGKLIIEVSGKKYMAAGEVAQRLKMSTVGCGIRLCGIVLKSAVKVELAEIY